MNKIGLVIQREYLSRVKKKSFLLTTILVPIIIIGFYAIIIAISVSDSGDKYKVAVIDEAGLFNEKVEKEKNDPIEYVFINNETEQSYKSKYKAAGYDYFLYLPNINIDQPRGMKLHSPSAISIGVKNKIEKVIDRAIEDKRLKAANIDADRYKKINSNVSIDNTIDSGDKEKKSVAGVAYAVSFACGILIYMILLIYGTMVMRGVMEEKTSRIAEVIVSSVKPFQLMLGKIIGIGAVGVTQFFIWIILMFLLQAVLPAIFPSLSEQMTQPAATENISGASPNMFATVSEGLRSLPVGLILFCFLFYFIGGYLLYASMFAAIGSVVSEDQQEAQQLVFPVMMPIILAFVIMVRAIAEPNSSLAIFGSLFPLTSPIVMMGRITYDVPIWQLITSMLLLVLSFIFFTWLTAKIYRTGILLYGKRITWKEMLKWAFRSS